MNTTLESYGEPFAADHPATTQQRPRRIVLGPISKECITFERNNTDGASEWTLMTRGILALVWKTADVQPLIDSDHALNLSENVQLREARSEVQEQSKRDTAVNVTKRLSILSRNIFWSFVILASAVAVSLLFSHLAPSPSVSCRAWLGALSMFSFAWATLGRLGWPGQSWKGDTVVERLDGRIFKFLYWLGTFLGILALV